MDSCCIRCCRMTCMTSPAQLIVAVHGCFLSVTCAAVVSLWRSGAMCSSLELGVASTVQNGSIAIAGSACISCRSSHEASAAHFDDWAGFRSEQLNGKCPRGRSCSLRPWSCRWELMGWCGNRSVDDVLASVGTKCRNAVSPHSWTRPKRPSTRLAEAVVR